MGIFMQKRSWSKKEEENEDEVEKEANIRQ
jgi:hypothetical protein